jgi:gliding motility-associated-like protein
LNNPTADFTWPQDICSATIQLDASASTAQGQSISSYDWDFNNDGTVDQSTTQPTVTYTFPGAGNQTVTLTVNSNEGCSDQVTHTVNIPNTLTVQVTSSTDISCFGASDGSATAMASGGTTPYTYSWNTTPAQTTATATNLPAGTWTVTVTDDANCTATASVIINNAAPLNVSITNVQHVTCNGLSNGQATAQVTGGTGTINYSWNTTPVQTTATATNLAAGTWTVTVTDGNNCIGSASVQITEPQPLVVQASSVNISCFGQNNGQLSAAANGGTGTISYSWNTAPPSNSQTVNNVPAGNYTVTATDQNGCTATAQATVTQPSQIVLQTTYTNVTCPGGNDGAATVQGSGGTGTLSYAWNTLPPATGSSVSNLTAGTYTVIATDQNGCQASATVTITELSVPMQHSAQVTNVTCGGMSNGGIDLTMTQGTGPFQFSWSNGASSEDLNGVPGGTYTVNVSDANGCPYTATFVVNENPVLQLSTTVTPILCYGDQTGSIKVQVQGGTPSYSYAWNGQPGTSELSNVGAGTYSIVVTDANNCQASTQVTIPSPPQITISHTPEYEIFMGQGTDLVTMPSGGTGSLFIQWDPEVYLSCSTCNVPYANPVRDTRYTITATDANGCKASADIWVRVIKVGPFIPTAFTPTGDNKNEVFRVIDYGVTDIDIRIYDRWGNEVYSSNDLYEGWDGTVGGKKAEQGTYIYRITTKYIDGKTKVYTGHVTLVR